MGTQTVRAVTTLFCLCLLSLAGLPLHAQTPASPRIQLTEPPYLLQVGDTVEIFYRITPEYNQTVTILPGGDVSLQLIGTVHLAGLDLHQAHDVLVERAGVRLRNPDLSISLKDVNKDHYAVIGEVSSPGRFDLHGPVSVLEALSAAGGFHAASSQSNVVLIRRLSPTSEYGEASQIDFRKLRHRNTSTDLPMMHNGDVLWVTSSKFSKVERVIKLVSPGVYYPLP